MLAFPVRRPLRMLIATLLLAGSFVALLAASGTANAASRHRAPKASAARVAVARLQRASHAARVADHRFVALARALKRCQRRHAGSCHAPRHALQLAGRRLRRAQRTLNRLARKDAKGRATATLPAPTISVNGQKLSWNAVSNVSRYVFVRKVPGQADQYSVISGTSITPPAVPGATVSYSVRADATGSAWARAVSISYPAIQPGSTPAPSSPAP
ncbi:MAG TPA: hypothetical protein VN635_11560, partial [Conexibacter sp.]|nr:hypothetical protein [Conexibacter sp.]